MLACEDYKNRFCVVKRRWGRKRKQIVHENEYAWSSNGMRNRITLIMLMLFGKTAIVNTIRIYIWTEKVCF